MSCQHIAERRFNGARPLLFAMLLLAGLGLTERSVAAEADEPTVSDIRVIGGETLTATNIKGMLGTREGRPLDRRVLDEDFQRLSKLDSIANVQIKENRSADGSSVALTILLREKDIIRRIVFEGNSDVRTRTLEGLIQSKVGDRFDPGQVNRDVRALQDYYQEKYYYFADVEATPKPFEDGIRLVFSIGEGGKHYVKDVVFRGNHSIPDEELHGYMETKPSSFFTRGKYNRRTFDKDLERLRLYYQSKGHLDIVLEELPMEISTGRSLLGRPRREVTLYINVEEGPEYRVGKVDFEGNNLVETSRLLTVVETTPGEVFNPTQVREDANRIRDIYGLYPSSRYFTKVYGERVLTPDGPIVDVLFHIAEGEEVIVESFEIIGLTKTKDHVFRRLSDILPGEKIDSKKVNETERQFRNTGYIDPATMSFDVKEGFSAPNRAIVSAEVEETTTGRLQLGAGFSTTENFLGTVELSQSNFDYTDFPKSWRDFFLGQAFKGGGQRFNIAVSAGSRSQNVGFDFLNPWIYHRPIRFGFGGFWRDYEYRRYTENRVGGYLRLGRRLDWWSKNLDASVTYRLEQVELSDFDSSSSPELRAEEGDNLLSRVIFNIEYDTRDNRFDPRRGMRLSLSQEVVGGILGGDQDFYRTFLDGAYLHTLYEDSTKRPWVLAFRGDISTAKEYGDSTTVPIYERLYAGGVNSIRGFRTRSISPRDSFGDEIGGKLRIEGGVEMFAPVYQELIRASVFYDIGGVWDEYDNLDDDLWRSSVGFGLHVKTPLSPVPIRLYFSEALDSVDGDDKRGFEFALGLQF